MWRTVEGGAGSDGRTRSQAVPEPPLPAVDGDGGEDDEAVDDLLDRGTRSVADEHRGQDGEEERSDAGARVVTRSPEHRSSDDHRDHALEQIGIAKRAVDRAGEAADQQTH